MKPHALKLVVSPRRGPFGGRATLVGLWLDDGWVSLRVWRRYFKLRDMNKHRRYFSEREGFDGYRPLVRIGSWEFGVNSRHDH
jgi:hypothetical protein